MNHPNINQLRVTLLATLDDLRDRKNPMEPDRARAISGVAAVLVDSARVEVEFMRVTGGDTSTFLTTPSQIVPITHDVAQTTFAGGGSPFDRLGARA